MIESRLQGHRLVEGMAPSDPGALNQYPESLHPGWEGWRPEGQNPLKRVDAATSPRGPSAVILCQYQVTQS